MYYDSAARHTIFVLPFTLPFFGKQSRESHGTCLTAAGKLANHLMWSEAGTDQAEDCTYSI